MAPFGAFRPLVFLAGLVSCLAQDETCDAATGKCSSGPGEPHGGALVDLMVADATSASAATATLELSQRQACDVSLLINGGFSARET
eukprot:g31232.t1